MLIVVERRETFHYYYPMGVHPPGDLTVTLERKLRARGLHPYFITGHTGWTDNFAFAFAHKDKSCSPFKKRVHDPSAPYDAYDESDDTEENAKSGFLKGVGR